MRRTLPLLALLALAWAAKAQTTHELTNVGTTFSPNLITMDAGDNIHLVLTGNHTCTQVDESTWNANGNTSNGGFNFGAGENTFSLDVPGTYYYVCIPHAGLGMKGRLIVLPTTGVEESAHAASLAVFPNPAVHEVHITGIGQGRTVQVLDATGRIVLDMGPAADGLFDISDLTVGRYSVAVRDAAGHTMAVKPLVVLR
ncbi:MAG: hypothetical protein KBH07_03265 [Flavobacteriales bacterium]|nr:hypothetical protein [Flavobacteriales bacterium]MBP9080883.1 hypothetical protein [Flavobacteriales bacterium]